jgi:alpha-glucoside transport system permease protein
MTAATPAIGGSRTQRWLRKRVVQILLAIIALTWLVPGIGLLITSLRPVEKYGDSGWWSVFAHPSELTLQNYVDFLGDSQLVRSVWNTVLIAVPATLFPVLLAAMAGYALAWIPFRGRNTLFLIIVAMLVVPLQMALIPAFQIFNSLNLTGIPAVWVFHTAFGLPFAIFLMRNYYAGLPSSLMEAARIDGATEWRIFSRIVLPLGWPALASLAIFQFTWTWNDLLVALVFAGNSRPFTVEIQNRLGEFSSGIGIIGPGVFIGAILPIAIFFAFQRYFEAGLLGGSVK